MKINRFISLLGLLFVFLVGCSIFNKEDTQPLQPVLILSPDELPSTLAGQKAFFFSTQRDANGFITDYLIMSLNQEFQAPLSKKAGDFRITANRCCLIYTEGQENFDIQVHLLDLHSGEDQILFESKDVPGGVTYLGIEDPFLSFDEKKVLFKYNAYNEKWGNSYSEEFGLGIYSLEDRSIQTITKVGINSHPEFSLTGDKILSICEGKEAVGFQVCIMNSDGSNRQRLSDVRGTHDDWLSNDGEHIVYQQILTKLIGDTVYGLYAMDFDGKNIVQLHDKYVHFLTFSDDGKDVVFCVYPNDGLDPCEGVYVIGIDGRNLRRLAYLDGDFLSKWK